MSDIFRGDFDEPKFHQPTLKEVADAKLLQDNERLRRDLQECKAAQDEIAKIGERRSYAPFLGDLAVAHRMDHELDIAERDLQECIETLKTAEPAFPYMKTADPYVAMLFKQFKDRATALLRRREKGDGRA